MTPPWRGPTSLIVYTSGALDADDLESVEAGGIADANVIIRMPRRPVCVPG